MRKRHSLWILLLLALPCMATAQSEADSAIAPALPSQVGNVVVWARLDTTALTVGEQTQLRIHVGGLQDQPVRMPNVEELSRGAIEALESSNDTLRDKSGHVTDLESTVLITAFEAGHHAVTGIVVAVGDGQQLVMLAPADSLLLDVSYVAEADTTKCEVKADIDYESEPYTFWEVCRWVLYALLAVAVVLAVVWILKRRKEHKPIVVLPRAKPAPADKRALAELETLRRKELWQKGRIKKYYTDMTDIVRRFLRNMYGINAGEMTTRQTLRAFHGIADWSEQSDSLLRQLLQKADMVKFAKSQPESHEHDQAMQNSIDFIRTVAETHKINNPETEEKK